MDKNKVLINFVPSLLELVENNKYIIGNITSQAIQHTNNALVVIGVLDPFQSRVLNHMSFPISSFFYFCIFFRPQCFSTLFDTIFLKK